MIIYRYVLREVAAPFVAISFALATLYVTYSLTRYLTDATEGVLAASSVFTLTMLKALIALEMLLPVALYIGLIVTLGRLYSDWEVTAMRASGISERQIIIPILGLAAAIALCIAGLSLGARPWAYNALYEFQAQAKAFNDLGQLEAGRFHYDDKRSRVVFMDARDGPEDLSGLFVRTREGSDTQVVSADSGRFTAYATPEKHRLDLRDARILRIGDEGTNLVGSFETFTLWLPSAIPHPVGYKPKRMTSQELRHARAPDARCSGRTAVAPVHPAVRPAAGHAGGAPVPHPATPGALLQNHAGGGHLRAVLQPAGRGPHGGGAGSVYQPVVGTRIAAGGGSGRISLRTTAGMSIDRYLILSMIRGGIPILGLLLGLFAFLTLAEELEDVGRGNFEVIDALNVMMLSLPKISLELLPVTSLVGVLVGLGTLASQQELIALRAAGWSNYRIGRSVILLALGVVITALAAQQWLVPFLEQPIASLRANTLLETNLEGEDGRPTGRISWRRIPGSFTM
jgi:lipopolysaccharide export system permease protein